MRRLPLLLVLLAGALAFAPVGCGGGEARGPGGPEDAKKFPAGPESAGRQISVSGGSYTRVTASEFEPLTREEGVAVVNTHVPFQGKLPRTDLSIPYDEVGQSLDELPEDKDAKIALYCLGGPMSAAAAETLVGLGYTNVWDLGGGMEAWQDAGYRLEGR
ncbi:rhodanese-like domain-containing protein (plasmid) [Rubrobacter tropicus]|uniref:Rhodanese-like domain-containing protein n=1 Tax=Rubrobacter tropicus TaxID=2653851 RepID=A0A6G8QG69_9ACTN|nr:rhodanese-like domain-containing protein [Rubrobacter tropicus]QIN85401.1 rhodanese-like domain-containing protein [Rubrobacter tropicus]